MSSLKKLFNCNEVAAFEKTIIDTLKLSTYSHSSFHICQWRKFIFFVKVAFYTKSPPEVFNRLSKKTMHHIDAEVKVLTRIREKIIMANVSPCCIEILYHKSCKASNVIKKSPKHIEHKEFKNLLDADLAIDKMQYIVLEHANFTFFEYLKNIKDLAIYRDITISLLFQLAYTLEALQAVFPGFRHYDLHSGNVMCKIASDYKFDVDNIEYMQFDTPGGSYFVPYFGIIIKIIDFGFSVMPSENIRSNMIDNPLLFYWRKDTPDMHVFLHYITSHAPHMVEQFRDIKKNSINAKCFNAFKKRQQNIKWNWGYE